MVNLSASEAIASFLEDAREDLLGTLRKEADFLNTDEAFGLVEEWLTSQIEYLRGGPGRTRAWIAVLVDRVRGRGGDIGEILDRVQVIRNVAIQFCLGKIEGVSDAEIYRVVLEAEDQYLKVLGGLYAEVDRKTLAAEQRKQHVLTEAMRHPLVMLDGEGAITLANSRFADLVGTRQTDLTGREFASLCAPETAAEVRRDLRQKRSARARTFKGAILDPKGRQINRTFWVLPVFDDQGFRSGIAIAMPEMAGGPAAEGDALCSKLLQGVASELDLGVYVVDRSYKVVSANALARTFLDIEPGQIIDGDDCGDCSHESVMQTGAPCRTTIHRETEAGDARWLEIAALPLFHDDHGHVTHVAKLVRDVTEQRLLQDQILRQQRGSLVAQTAMTAAHQLRNPLAVMIGFAEMLSQGLAPDQVAGAADKVLRSGMRCKQIVENLLEFGKSVPGERAVTDLNQIVRERVQPMFPASVARRITWRLAPSLPPVECAPQQLAQVFANLLDNALWAATSEVVFETSASESKVYVRVRDDGPGVPKENHRHIFEPFFSTREEEDCIGLGLSLSRTVMQEHRGLLYLDETAVGETCFVAQLPVTKDVVPAEQPGESPETASREGGRILVVDDEVDLLDLLATALQSRGHHVETAATGAHALDLMRSTEYDLAVLDVLLPDELGGRELYQIMLGANPALAERTMFITADTMNYETRHFLEEAKCPHMEKPFLVSDFIDTVEHLLETPHTKPDGSALAPSQAT